MVYENIILRKIFGSERDEVTEENCIMNNFIIRICRIFKM